MILRSITYGILTYILCIILYAFLSSLLQNLNKEYLPELLFFFYFVSNFSAGFISGYISKLARIDIGMLVGTLGLLIFTSIAGAGMEYLNSNPKFLIVTLVVLAGLSNVYGATISSDKDKALIA